MREKVSKQMFFSVITKNLKWEILTENLVPCKRWDEVKEEILRGFTEKSNFYEGSQKSNI